jgi:hypothetical protein
MTQVVLWFLLCILLVGIYIELYKSNDNRK